MNKQSELAKELDAYIRQKLISEEFPHKELFTAVGAGQCLVGAVACSLSLDFLLKKIEMTFSEKLLQLIKKKGRTSAEVYTKAGLTRAHFAKIKADKAYHPSKATALAFAVALHLDLEETADLIKRAGYTISHSSVRDIIVEFFIDRKIYNLDEINNQLYIHEQQPLTNWRQSASE